MYFDSTVLVVETVADVVVVVVVVVVAGVVVDGVLAVSCDDVAADASAR